MKRIALKTGQLIFSVRGLLFLLMISVLVTGCESYRRFKKTVKGQKNLVYQINTTGNTNQTAYISTRDLVEILGEEGGLYTTITQFRLTSMKIGITPVTGNTATNFQLLSLEATSTYNSALNPWTIADLKNYPTTFPLNASGAFLINSILSSTGIATLNDVVEKELVGRNLAGLVDKQIGITLKGANIPTNSRAAVTMTISLDVTMEYSTCHKVPEFLFSENFKCE